MNPERFNFLLVLSIMGYTPRQAFLRYQSDPDAPVVTEQEIKVIYASDLFQKEREELTDQLRRACIKTAADELLFANADAARFLRDAMHNLSYKPNTRMRAAIEILDRIPQTSKTLRQYVGEVESSVFTDEQIAHLNKQMQYDRKALAALVEGDKKEAELHTSLRKLLDV